jgi:hypothetical protein
VWDVLYEDNLLRYMEVVYRQVVGRGRNVGQGINSSKI